jgi:hypothetical protein
LSVPVLAGEPVLHQVLRFQFHQILAHRAVDLGYLFQLLTGNNAGKRPARGYGWVLYLSGTLPPEPLTKITNGKPQAYKRVTREVF